MSSSISEHITDSIVGGSGEPPSDKHVSYLQELTLDKSECLHAVDGVCISTKVLPAVALVTPLEAAEPLKIIEAAEKILGCDTESCVIMHPKVHEAAKQLDVLKDLQHDLKYKFKPVGPRNSTALLSNVHIDAVMRQWATEFTDFYAAPFAMADFETNGDAFGKIKLADLYSGKGSQNICRTFGCIHNTDVSRGRGIHWVAVFVDMRAPPESTIPWTLEYFNSAGRAPAVATTRWMERQRADLIKLREELSASVAVEVWAVSNVSHQNSQTECGPYALYYIRRRLEGAAPKDFMDSDFIIPDSAMTEFRQYLFRQRNG